MKRSKVVIIGAGHVGNHCASSLILFGVCNEIVLIDLDEEKARSNAMDLADSMCFMPHPVEIRVGSYEDCTDADIVIISAGVKRLPGQTRLDTLGATIQTLKPIIPKLQASAFSGILVTISNPADIVANYFRSRLNLPKSRVFGTGTSLDTARLKRVLSEKLSVDRRSITACCLGEHGDSSMIPFSTITVGQKPFYEYIKEHEPVLNLDLHEVLTTTRRIGMDIIEGKGSTEYGIGAVAADLCKAILNDEHRVLPVSAYLEDEYGQKELHIGVPAVIGANGIEEIIELKLDDEEMKLFHTSCDVIKQHIRLADEI